MGYEFVPTTLEIHGRLGKPLLQLLGDVGARAAEYGQGPFTEQHFVKGVLQELSVCLCGYNAMLESRVAGVFVEASGIAIKHNLS
jgi:hypothetical protein